MKQVTIISSTSHALLIFKEGVVESLEKKIFFFAREIGSKNFFDVVLANEPGYSLYDRRLMVKQRNGTALHLPALEVPTTKDERKRRR